MIGCVWAAVLLRNLLKSSHQLSMCNGKSVFLTLSTIGAIYTGDARDNDLKDNH